jgi:hypothetical protein
MTREEQILNKAINYSEIEENFLEYDDCGDVCDDKYFVEKAFISGAKWADENPNNKLVYTKKELLDMGFGFDLNGNISTPQEIEEKTKKYINYRKDKWIKKACDWLENELFEDKAEINPYYATDVKSKSYDTLDQFINNFKKAMEE